MTVADFERTCANFGLRTATWKFPNIQDMGWGDFRFELEPVMETPFSQLKWRNQISHNIEEMTFQKEYAKPGKREVREAKF